MFKKIKDLYRNYKNSRGRKIFFFTFYTIFFLAIFIYLGYERSNPNNNYNNDNVEDIFYNNDSLYNTKKLDNDFYKYKITIQNNYDLKLFTGDLNNSNGLSDYEYNYLFDIPNIKQMLKNAKYLSKNLFSSDQYKINYEINNYNLCRIFNNMTLNNSMKENNNSIVVITDINSEIIGFEYDFSNYINLINNSISIYKVTINYEF